MADKITILPPDAGSEEVCRRFGLDEAACARLRMYAAALRRWNARVNLVAPSTLAQAWVRHVADGLQLLPVLRRLGMKRVIDLGTGGGVPGLVLALADPSLGVHLVESTARKCAFLRQVARQGEIDINIHQARIESLDPAMLKLDARTAVTARALAPLPRLLGLAEPLLRRGAVALLLKGRSLQREMQQASEEKWRFDSKVIPSVTDAEGNILLVREVRRG